MPELAEVEYFRKQWDAGLGARIVAVLLHPEKRIFRGINPALLERRLVRQKFLSSSARGKQMLFQFSGENWLGIHLGMSGTLRVEPSKFVPEKHDHLVLQQRERDLVFRDARQFGRVRFHHGKNPPDWWQASAPDIHSPAFTSALMQAFVRRHARAPIKGVLLMQRGFPGIGNWMADEILWRAGILPKTPSGKLNPGRLNALYRATRFVVRASLKSIGHDNSEPPASWLLHQRWRAGGKCPRHGDILRRETISGRTTAWCPKCQK